jgi:hypothetical protein
MATTAAGVSAEAGRKRTASEDITGILDRLEHPVDDAAVVMDVLVEGGLLGMAAGKYGTGPHPCDATAMSVSEWQRDHRLFLYTA